MSSCATAPLGPQQAYLKASNTDSGDNFGVTVALSGDTVIVGAGGEASNATGINGDQSNDSAPSAGAAYVFARNGATWAQQAYLKASNTDANDIFASVAFSGDTVVVGAPYEASNASGINGDQTDNSAPQAGAVYVFTGFGPTSIPSSNLLNISTRMQVLTDDKLLIGGFIITGNAPKKVILRAIGPALADFGLNGVLADPVLELHMPDMTVVTNDNWKETQQTEIEAARVRARR
jgi:hypothetical protein